VDLWPATQFGAGAAASSVRRRLSALSSFYRYCVAHDLVGRVPTHGVARPSVDPDYTATVGLDRDQARALVAPADADTGQLSPHSLRRSAITFALDVGASLRDVQDYAGHKDPRTSHNYDHSRDSLDCNAAFTVAVYLA
jgi:site-specific recombinase XerD